MKIWTDKVKFNVYSQESAEYFKQELIEKVKSSKKINNDSRAYQNSLYFVSNDFIWFLQPFAPEFRIRIRFGKLIKNDNHIAIIYVRGNIALSSFKYFVMVLFFIVEFTIIQLDAFPTEKNELLINSLIRFVMFIILITIFQKMNKTCIEDGIREMKLLIDNKKYKLKS